MVQIILGNGKTIFNGIVYAEALNQHAFLLTCNVILLLMLRLIILNKTTNTIAIFLEFCTNEYVYICVNIRVVWYRIVFIKISGISVLRTHLQLIRQPPMIYVFQIILQGYNTFDVRRTQK